MCYPAEFGRSRSNGTSVIRKIRLKNMTYFLPPFSSLKVIGTDTYRSATYDFLVTFHSNHGPKVYLVPFPR